MSVKIDRLNKEFWNEICGTHFAKARGIEGYSLDCLQKFDKAYFDFYPYLIKNVKGDEMQGKRVLEIGLGYGSLGQKIAESQAYYNGLDVADNPVRLMNYRLRAHHLRGEAIVGSILNCPFGPDIFDYVVSIGCFHHTGNLRRCIDETYRILKPGGRAMIMVYSKYSYLQWLKWPFKTFLVFLHEAGLYRKEIYVSEEQRKAFDSNSAGVPAPETIFSSIKELRDFFLKYSEVKMKKENCSSGPIPIPRHLLLMSIGKILGTDIYIEARK